MTLKLIVLLVALLAFAGALLIALSQAQTTIGLVALGLLLLTGAQMLGPEMR